MSDTTVVISPEDVNFLEEFKRIKESGSTDVCAFFETKTLITVGATVAALSDAVNRWEKKSPKKPAEKPTTVSTYRKLQCLLDMQKNPAFSSLCKEAGLTKENCAVRKAISPLLGVEGCLYKNCYKCGEASNWEAVETAIATRLFKADLAKHGLGCITQQYFDLFLTNFRESSRKNHAKNSDRGANTTASEGNTTDEEDKKAGPKAPREKKFRHHNNPEKTANTVVKLVYARPLRFKSNKRND
jgi:hypothetical protein